MLTQGKCIVCGSDKRSMLLEFQEINTYCSKHLSEKSGMTITYMICTECGFVYQDPLPDKKDLDLLYSEKYRPVLDFGFFEQQAASFENRAYPWITENIPATGTRTVLDIGCGSGSFLVPFRNHGWKTYGIEPTQNISEAAREHFGLEITTGYYTPSSFPDTKYNLIVLSHVIEHVLDPAALLEDIKSNMDEREGYLYIGAPNIMLPMYKRILGEFFASTHLWFFSPRTLRRFIGRRGLVPVAIENWYPRGIRALVRKAGHPLPADDSLGDDYRVILRLYKTLFDRWKSGGAEEINRVITDGIRPNPLFLSEISRKIPVDPIAIHADNKVLNNASLTLQDGRSILLYREGNTAREIHRLAKRSGLALSLSPHKTIVLLGMGIGLLARELGGLLQADQKVIIYEDNIALLKTLFLKIPLMDFLCDTRFKIAVNKGHFFTALEDERKRTGLDDFLLLTDVLINPAYQAEYNGIVAALKEKFLKSS
ncbi:MAG: class I SAM-dependent methyltransferase [Thermodesulfovibrionales bacterium]